MVTYKYCNYSSLIINVFSGHVIETLQTIKNGMHGFVPMTTDRQSGVNTKGINYSIHKKITVLMDLAKYATVQTKKNY